MPRYKMQKAVPSPQKAVPSPQKAKFHSPNVVLRRSRRATLAGPAQLLGKQSISPVVMLEGNVMGEIQKALSNAGKRQSPAAKKTGSKLSPKVAKAATKPKSPSPRRSRRAPAKLSPKLKSPKEKKVKSPKKKSVTLKKKPTSPTKKPQTPAPKKTSNSPKAKLETPSRLYGLRSAAPASSPKLVHRDKTGTQSTRKTANSSRKRDRSASPPSRKKTKVTAASLQKSPVARAAEKKTLPPKLAGKRKRDTVSEEDDTERVSPPQKKKLVKSEHRSATKKTLNKASNVSFTEVKSKRVNTDSVKPGVMEVSSNQPNSTPLKAKLAENDVSMGWNVSSIRKKLLDSITLYRVKSARKTPASANARPIKSALFSAKKADSPERRTTRRQSVRFLVNGKADTVKQLKQRSHRKRFCYRMCQYMLLVGLPAAVAVASVLVYTGLI